jgi:hypothetical protein
MLSATECIAKADELSKLADHPLSAPVRSELLSMARSWLEVARVAEQQDALGDLRTHRVQ